MAGPVFNVGRRVWPASGHLGRGRGLGLVVVLKFAIQYDEWTGGMWLRRTTAILDEEAVMEHYESLCTSPGGIRNVAVLDVEELQLSIRDSIPNPLRRW